MQTAPPAAVRTALHDLETALATTRGVESASFAVGVPVEGGDQALFWVDGRPQPQSQDQMSWTVSSIVGPSYFTTMKIPLQRGRVFSERDNEGTPTVVVIDDVFARMHFPDEDPVGKRIHVGTFDFEAVEIVGVVGHVKMFGIDQDATTNVRAQLYISFRQLPDPVVAGVAAGLVVLARTQGDHASAIASVRSTVERAGGENVMFRIRTAGEIIAGYQATRRFAMYVLATFAVIALVLCCIGIYGVVSYSVTRRTTELGIRMALGATAATIMRLVLREGLRLTLVGVLVGLVAACFVTRFMSGMLFGVPAIDPMTFASVAGAVTLVGLIALVFPARRATRMDVLQALRTE